MCVVRTYTRQETSDCSATSTPGEGSDFWFTVLVEAVAPDGHGVADSGMMPLGPPDETEVRNLLRGRRLLVVEDDRVNRVILEEMLRSLGVEDLVIAEDGKEAIDAAGSSPFDLVLMDMQLPGVDGLEATRRIRGMHHIQQPRIVALTANVLPDDVARCLGAGMDSHLPKPFSRAELVKALTHWL